MKKLFAFLLALATPALAAPLADNAPDWYYPQWLAEAPHAPVFRMRDTVKKYCRYASQPSLLDALPLLKYTCQPSTAGCYTADDAIRALRLADSR